jgi:HAMP domain-containing protein
MRPKNRRKKVLIGRLQCRFVGFLLGYFLLLMFTLVGILVIPPVVQLSLYQDDFSVVSAAATQLLYLHSRLWPALGLVLLLFMVHSVLFSHRIAGPLFRIRRLLKEIGAGDLGMEVAIRRKDYLHLEVEALNGMLRNLENRIGDLSGSQRRASAALGRLQEAASEPLPAAYEDLRRSLDEMRESLALFRLTPADGAGGQPPLQPVSSVIGTPPGSSGRADESGAEVRAAREEDAPRG